jgi:hypothetical protein
MRYHDEHDKNRAENGSSQSRLEIEISGLSGTLGNVGIRDPLYLFACHLEWHNKRNVAAYRELLAALDDPDERNRAVAEALLKRGSPRPQPGQ